PPKKKLFPVFSSAISRCMRFLHDAGANVHIAVIIFFDMLKDGCKSTHNIRWQKRQDRGNGKGIAGER
ncbi:hypothetical protein, partial [Escherichia coli]|uniref:hypothetical protein n=1 Tax=Escherichia coli TaxID=562 RepID=UPI0021C6977C